MVFTRCRGRNNKKSRLFISSVYRGRVHNAEPFTFASIVLWDTSPPGSCDNRAEFTIKNKLFPPYRSTVSISRYFIFEIHRTEFINSTIAFGLVVFMPKTAAALSILDRRKREIFPPPKKLTFGKEIRGAHGRDDGWMRIKSITYRTYFVKTSKRKKNVITTNVNTHLRTIVWESPRNFA